MSPRRLTAAFAALLLMPVPETAGEGTPSPTAEAPATGSPATGPPTARPLEARPLEADQQQLRQVLVETRILTDRSRPGLSLWVRDAGLAFSRWMAGWMGRVLPRFARRAAPFFEPAVMLLLALLTALLLVFLVRFAFERWRQSARPATPVSVRHLGATTDRAAARDWEAELRRRLERGDVAASIEALWWWLANGLVAERAEPSWTSRELITKAGRRDLLADVQRLDRMMYGAARPSTDDVGRLWSDLQRLVG